MIKSKLVGLISYLAASRHTFRLSFTVTAVNAFLGHTLSKKVSIEVAYFVCPAVFMT